MEKQNGGIHYGMKNVLGLGANMSPHFAQLEINCAKSGDL
jgi:hypothetical protein